VVPQGNYGTEQELSAAAVASAASAGAGVDTTLTISAGNTGITDGTVYQVYAVDGARNISQPAETTFIADLTRPEVAALSPENGATGVAVDTDLVIAFSEQVIAQSDGNITLYYSDQQIAIAADDTSQVGGSGTNTITVTPSVPLEHNTHYYVQVDWGAFTDLAGNPFLGIADDSTWCFDTGAEQDNVPPTVSVSTVAGDNVVNIAEKAAGFNVVAQSSEGTGSIYVVPQGNYGTEQELSAAAVSSAASAGAGVDTTIPVSAGHAGITDGTVYQIYAVDGAGNISQPAGTTFRADLTRPSAATLFPSNGATGVAVDTDLEITFNEDVVARGGNLLLKETLDDSTVVTIPVEGTQVTVNNSEVRVNLGVTLEPNNGYYVNVEQGAFTDTAGNNFAGITDKTFWNFSTADSSFVTLTVLTRGEGTITSIKDTYQPGETVVIHAIPGAGWKFSHWELDNNNIGDLPSLTLTMDDKKQLYAVFDRDPAARISAGEFHTLYVDNSESVWAWGNNTYGQLGIGVRGGTRAPVRVKGPQEGTDLTGVAVVAAGNAHSAALKNDGTVWTWGNNYRGILGDGTTETRFAPVQVKKGDSYSTDGYLHDVVNIALGEGFSVALKDDGTVWTWGNDSHGTLGLGGLPHNYQVSPVQVSKGNSSSMDDYLHDIVDISAGLNHVVALKSDGTVWTWGSNNQGQLGINVPNNIIKTAPVQVVGGLLSDDDYLYDVVAISAGSDHTLALKKDGTVWAWGKNDCGQLGWGRISQKVFAPVQVIERNGVPLTGVCAVAAGGDHSVAVKTDGTVWVWGDVRSGLLGNAQAGDNIRAPYPVQVPQLSNMVAVTAGAYHNVACQSGDTLWAWGDNRYRQIGNGTTENALTPVQVNFKPEAPGFLKLKVISNSEIKLSWVDKSRNESGFKIERSETGAAGTWVEVGTTDADRTSYTDTGLHPDTTYYYRVYAYNSMDKSTYSNIKHAVTRCVQVGEDREVAINPAENEQLNVNVPSGTGGARMNISQSTTVDEQGNRKAVFAGGININVSTAAGEMQVTIPAGTEISGPGDEWNGIINVPTVTEVEHTISNARAVEAIEIGFGDVELQFDKPVKILFEGKSGKRVGYSRSGQFHEITRELGVEYFDAEPGAVQSAMGNDREAYVDNGTDIAVWTTHFTKFITYEPVETSSGGGGGSPSNQRSKKIEAGEGGTLTYSGAVVEVPGDALSADTTFTIKKLSSWQKERVVPADLRVKLCSDVYEITTSGGAGIDGEITVKLAYDDADVGEEERPVMHYYDGEKEEWVEVKTAVEYDEDEGVFYAVAKVNHPAKFAVFRVAKEVEQPAAVSFTDVEGYWAEEAVYKLAAAGLINGYPDGTFRPEKEITRLEVTVILARALGLGENSPGIDVFADAGSIPRWARGAVGAAVKENLVQGYRRGDGELVFSGSKLVTRTELVVMIARVLERELGTIAAASPQFADAEKIPGWAKRAVGVAVAKGIIGGYPDGTFRPEKRTTRAEAATMLLRVYSLIN